MRDELSRLSYWFPRLEAAGIPVPRTILLDMPREAIGETWDVLDGSRAPRPHLEAFADQVADAARTVGLPAFLRTDHTSGKHDWQRTCRLVAPQQVLRHVMALIEYSHLVDMIGLPFDKWAVREFLPTRPVGHCPNFGYMPVVKEYRFFVRDGEVVCWHPYWSEGALRQGGVVFDQGHDVDSLHALDDLAQLEKLASAAGEAVGGEWSVDLLQTDRGWYVTDMAEAHRSGHYDCPNAALFMGSKSDLELHGMGAVIPLLAGDEAEA